MGTRATSFIEGDYTELVMKKWGGGQLGIFNAKTQRSEEF
jgi:hypothetical protein